MIHFSQRMKITESFRAWCKEAQIAESPFNMVAFLQIKGLLNEEKAAAEYPLFSMEEET